VKTPFFLLRSCFLVAPQSMLVDSLFFGEVFGWFPCLEGENSLLLFFGAKILTFGLHHAPSTFPTIRESGSLDRSAWESPSTTEVFPSFAGQIWSFVWP